MHPLTEKLQFLLPLAVMLLLSAGEASAQSGRSGMHGYVAFADLSYNEVAERKVHAKIELRRTADGENPITVETDEHGRFHFQPLAPGEYAMRITSPGYRAYETEIYLPSDFIGNLGVMLKKEKPAPR
jgi:hypothetical protein